LCLPLQGASCTSARYKLLVGSSLDEFDDNVGWRKWKRSPICRWNVLATECSLQSPDSDNLLPFGATDVVGDQAIVFEYDCPLAPHAYPDQPPELLPDWLGYFRNAELLSNVSVVDFSWPGTHDSLSYDLSLTISEDGLDKFHKLLDLLHTLSEGKIHLLPGELEEFLRMQAKTQQLTITQQLDNGIRFLDFRMMLEADSKTWYSIHFMQSRHTVEDYWREIRAWLDLHPNEIVILWLSREGNPTATGEDQFPHVTREEKQMLWGEYTKIFSGLLMNTTDASIFSTPLEAMLTQNYRVITFAADYTEFTDSSTHALDAARIENHYDDGNGVFSEEETMQQHLYYMGHARVNNAGAHARGHFTLLAMNSQVQNWQIMASAKKRFLGWSHDLLHRCSSHIKIPESPHYCPEFLLDIVQLASYYNQYVFEFALPNTNATIFRTNGGDAGKSRTAFPNAFYLDALDFDGTVRTSSQLLDGAERGGREDIDKKYAYVDTVLLYNVQQVCLRRLHDTNESCQILENHVRARRHRYPFQVWDDIDQARHSNWPQPKHRSAVGSAI